MIITLETDAPNSAVESVTAMAGRYKDVTPKTYTFKGASQVVQEVHLIGSTQGVPTEIFKELPWVRHVVRISRRYRLIGRHERKSLGVGFEHNGVSFDERTVNVFAGLCAVDTKQNVDRTMAALREGGVKTARMGAYKPRTSPYDFQGHGESCLPWVFELAGKYDIKVIAMEVTNQRQIEQVYDSLEMSGGATGVILQVGTRNAQNFDLLRAVGQQTEMPVLVKRGMGITLEESLNACEYIATEGNARIIFCLRGVKTHLGDPHRNLVDFGQVPVVRRLTRMVVCVDPSHSVGRMDLAPDGLPEIIHATGQGIIAGASAVLVDFHPDPESALCDGPQALTLEQLPGFLSYVRRVREVYEEVVATFVP